MFFVDGTYFRLTHSPYLCNDCPEKFGCKLTKYYFKVLPLFNSFKTLLTESRQGINMTELELSNLDSVVSPLIKKDHQILIFIKQMIYIYIILNLDIILYSIPRYLSSKKPFPSTISGSKDPSSFVISSPFSRS